MREFLLSIIIPTKNRQYYCKNAIKQILRCTSKSVQVVVQDNSDDESLRLFCEELNSNRVVYNHHNGVISFVDNFSEAVTFANGEYLCMIGDDDGVLPNIETITKHALENKLDAFVPGLNAVYSWPTESPVTPGAENGYLYITPMSSKIKKVNCKRALEKLLNRAFQDYQETCIPRLYHGIVHHSVMEKIKAQTGCYFGGLTPDMYMSIALGVVCEKVEHANFPITISGICPGSGSANSASGAHTGELKDAPHFIGHDSYEWNKLVPYFYSVETIWAETALHALGDMGKGDLSIRMNLAYFVSILKEKYPQFNDRISAFAKEYKISVLWVKWSYVYRKLARLFEKFIKLITRYRKKRKMLFNVKSIYVAERDICKYMKKNKIR